MWEKYIEEYEVIRSEYQKNVIETFKEDFNDYIENLFTAHSCAIEGNSFSVNDTQELKEHGFNLKLHNKTLCEAFEILDHFKAYEYAMTNLHLSLSEDFIKKLHFLLTQHTIEYRTRTGRAGEYTTTDMAAGDTLFGDHKRNIELMPKLLDQTQKIIDEKNIHPMVISAQLHKYFIYLHPFSDGNGRLGRLLSNFILAQQKLPLVVILSQDKNEYIEALKSSHKHRDNTPIISFFFETSIKQMKQEMEQKKNYTENFYINFEEEASKRKGLKR